MYLIAIAWLYVVLMMALAEALSPQGTLLGAGFTLVLYGLLPLSILLYILGTPLRRRRARRLQLEAAAALAVTHSAAVQGDSSSHASTHAQPPVGKEP
jgi:uncharacterized membrane protein